MICVRRPVKEYSLLYQDARASGIVPGSGRS
jgi:hypothetical protein